MSFNISIFINLFLAGFCGLAINFTLSKCGEKWAQTYQAFLTFVLLPVITFSITKVISNNVALALGMIGALSIVRFRNPVKNPLELTIYFALITIGICLSVNNFYGLGLTFAIITIFLFIKYFQNFFKKFIFKLSFNDGESKVICEIETDKDISNEFSENILINNINNLNENNYFYRVSFKNLSEANNLITQIKTKYANSIKKISIDNSI